MKKTIRKFAILTLALGERGKKPALIMCKPQQTSYESWPELPTRFLKTSEKNKTKQKTPQSEKLK